MKRIIFLLCFLSFSAICAQEQSPIVTDRPTQSASSTVLAKGSWLVEYGTLSERVDLDLSNLTYANVLIRYGVIEGLELRITQDFLNQKNAVGDLSETGFSPLTLGTKFHLIEGRGARPQVSAIAQVTVPTGSEAFNPSRAIPEIRFNLSNAITDRISLGYNFGMRFPEEGSSSFYTAVLGYSFLSGWTVFAEPYGFFGNGISDQRFNAGVIYLVTDRFQVDLSTGWGLSNQSPKSFVGFGLAYGF